MTLAEAIALLREAREAVEWDFDWSEHSQASDRKVALDLLTRIDAALAAHDSTPARHETVATFTMGNGNGTACTLCNVGSVETGVVIDTMPPMYGMRCPSCGDQWSRL